MALSYLNDKARPYVEPLAQCVGALTAFMVSDAAASITGSLLYLDGGYHILG